jgi:SH3 domain-containing YSC84-like protein 1
MPFGRGFIDSSEAPARWGRAPFSLSGISWGPQIGAKSTDLLMFIMNDQRMTDLQHGHIKVGADVSAAAGPVGPQALPMLVTKPVS